MKDDKVIKVKIFNTSIRITNYTRDRLSELGKKGDSYDNIINALMDYYEEHESKK